MCVCDTILKKNIFLPSYYLAGMVIENFLLGQISNKKWLKASICDVMCWCVSTKTVETKQMTWIEPWVFMHRLSVSHLVTVTSHIDATETTRAKCSWKMGLLRHSQTFGANTCTPCFGWRSQQEHWWAASRGKNEGGAGCGFDDSEARPPPHQFESACSHMAPHGAATALDELAYQILPTCLH